MEVCGEDGGWGEEASMWAGMGGHGEGEVYGQETVSEPASSPSVLDYLALCWLNLKFEKVTAR